MRYCDKCDQEYYEDEETCMCPTYRRRMEHGEYSQVPVQWIKDYWEDKLYCGICKSGYWVGQACDCDVYKAWIRQGQAYRVPDWYSGPR